MKIRSLPLHTLLRLAPLLLLVCTSVAFAADYDASESGFTITVPDDWKSSREGDPGAYSYTFMTEDERLAVGISAIEIQAGIALEDVIPLFEKNAFASAETLGDEPQDFNGMSGRLKAYRWLHDGQPLGVASFYAIAQGHFYAIWPLADFEQFGELAPLADSISNSFTLVPLPVASSTTHGPATVRLEIFETGTTLVDGHRIAEPMTRFSPDTPDIYAGFRTEGSLRGVPLELTFTYTTSDFTVFTNELLPENWQEHTTTEGHMTYSKPDKGWPAGNYRVDILHDGNLLSSSEFTVESPVCRSGKAKPLSQDRGFLFGVDDGTRTHDDRNHNPGLYQLSYAHH